MSMLPLAWPLISLVASATASASSGAPALHVETAEFKVSKVDAQPSGTSSAPRKRAHGTLVVFLSKGAVRIKSKDGRSLKFAPDVAQTIWRAAGTEDVIENVGRAPLSFFEVEVKDRAGAHPLGAFPALDPVKIDGHHYKTLLENERVRVVRAQVDPGDKIPMHQHDTSRVNIFVTKHDVRVTDPNGVSNEGHEPAGTVKIGGPCKHDEVSISDGPMDTVIIDSKFLP